MTSGRSGTVTHLARPVDLSSSWNASDRDLAGRLHPLYGQALERLPEGDSVFRGLPFSLGSRSVAKRWILVGDGLTIDLRDRGGPGRGDGRASHLVVAHFADSWRDPAGERPAGTPVGWVLPTGEPLARYELLFEGGRTRAVDVRRRFQIADGIIGWGFLPFEAVGHRADEAIDWRGPFPRQEPGRYADQLDISREPERHVAFGEGIHHCIGVPLARLEARIAFEELFPRIPEYTVTGPLVRILTPTDRAFEHLPVEF